MRFCEEKVKSGGSQGKVRSNQQRPPVRERPNTLRYSNPRHLKEDFCHVKTKKADKALLFLCTLIFY